MNSIFGIGPLELFFIAIIALVILGPERLPGVIREGMKYYRTLRNMSGDLTSQFSEELKALDEINPQKIMNEMMQDLDMEEERKVLADLNPKKIRKDISDSVNPLKSTAKKPIAGKAVEEAATTTATATATTAAAAAVAADEPAESKSAQPADGDGNGVDNLPTNAKTDDPDTAANTVPVTAAANTAGEAAAAEDQAAPVALTTAEILARSRPKMSSNPYLKSSKKSNQAETASSTPLSSASPPDSTTAELDEPIAENRIAPDELAANIAPAEPAAQDSPPTAAANGTHDSVEDRA